MKRRLAAVVAADIANYSWMLREDEQATLDVFEAVRRDVLGPGVAIRDGRVERMQGDSMLIEFANALDAVHFATEVQSAFAERIPQAGRAGALRFRMGICLGDVVGEGEAMHGEPINIAARLETLAEPGGICLSENVYSQARGKLGPGFEPIGPRQLKNIDEPVQVWRWRPPFTASNGDDGPARENVGLVSGCQVLDPRVTELLLTLHMRSARLAISDAMDAILAEPDAGRSLDIDGLYQRFGERINQARALLAPVTVERIDNFKDYLADDLPRQPLSEYMASVLDSNRTAFTMKLMPQFRDIVRSEDAPLEKRRRCMTLVETFLVTEMLPRTRQIIKFAFIAT